MKTGRGYGKPIIPFYLLWSAVLAVAFIIAVAKPAHSDEYIAPEPVVMWGFDTNLVQLQAPKKAWGIRSVARYIDANTSIDFEFAHCTQLECIKVSVDEYGYTKWLGMTYPTVSYMEVDLNSTYLPSGSLLKPARNNIACHELLHALGMPHHSGNGCLNQRQPLPSEDELNALREHYSNLA